MSKTLHALVVEDSPTMRHLIAHALARIKGLQVAEAGDGVEGLKKIRSEPFDILLTDINMPIMDGLKLVSLVRNFEDYKDIPIIIITTQAASVDRQRAMDLGANAYITKPIRASQVVACVRELLKGRNA